MKYHLRADVRYRLVKLFNELSYQLERDELGFDSPSLGNLMPRLHSVFVLLWCKRSSDLLCKKSSYSKAGYFDIQARVVSKDFLDRARRLVCRDVIEKAGFTDKLPF